MPEKYERIRDSYIARGKSVKEARRLGAMTYNAQRKKGQKPVTGHHESPLAPKKKG